MALRRPVVGRHAEQSEMERVAAGLGRDALLMHQPGRAILQLQSSSFRLWLRRHRAGAHGRPAADRLCSRLDNEGSSAPITVAEMPEQS